MRTKRAFDLFCAVVGLVGASPLLLVAAIAIKLTSKGPVLYRAQRIGRRGKPFTLFKLRTMRLGDDDRGGVTASDDPRVTKVGRVLRLLKLDEVPQLLNVLRGEMGVVGPRPEDPRYVEGFTSEQMKILDVLPGISSPASVAYRHEEQLIASHPGDRAAYYREVILPAKLSIDLEYMQRRSLWTDIGVMLRTALGVLGMARRTPASLL